MGSLSSASRTVNNFLSKSDQDRLRKVFLDGLDANDLQSTYYSVINLKSSLNENQKQGICGKLAAQYKDSKAGDFEKNYYYLGSAYELGCMKTVAAAVKDEVKASINKDLQSTQDLFFSFFAQKFVDEKVLDEAIMGKLVKKLQELLKKDDSLQSLGYGFFVASELGPAGSFAVDRVEDAMVQADEVDQKMLQFEGGLSITALVINGAYK